MGENSVPIWMPRQLTVANCLAVFFAKQLRCVSPEFKEARHSVELGMMVKWAWESLIMKMHPHNAIMDAITLSTQKEIVSYWQNIRFGKQSTHFLIWERYE